MIWIDGVFVDDAADAADAAGAGAGMGAAVFETIGRFGASLPLWDRHLRRLDGARQRLGDRASPPAGLRAAAEELLRHNGHDVVRLVRTVAGRGGSWSMSTRARVPATGGIVRLVPTVARRPIDAPPADLKALPRDFYAAVLAEARASGADDGIVVGDDGAVLETSCRNLWLRLDGVWVTPALDGRVLPGVARAVLLEHARGAGVRTAARRCDLADLHKAEELAVTNAARGPEPAVLGGVRRSRAATGDSVAGEGDGRGRGAATVENIDTGNTAELSRIWRIATTV